MGPDLEPLRSALESQVVEIDDLLGAANAAREEALPACRRAIRLAGSSIRAVHRLDVDQAQRLAQECHEAVRAAQQALEPHPEIAAAGFLHDAEKELTEAKVVASLVARENPPGPTELGVSPAAWLRGLAEAASELRRHLLDRLRDGDLERGEELLGAMDAVYGALVVVDYPDAVTNGLRRTLDSLRAVLERTRGDVTTTTLQTRLQRALEAAGSSDTER
jgi:translin